MWNGHVSVVWCSICASLSEDTHTQATANVSTILGQSRFGSPVPQLKMRPMPLCLATARLAHTLGWTSRRSEWPPLLNRPVSEGFGLLMLHHYIKDIYI